jgi:hypothetical protein
MNDMNTEVAQSCKSDNVSLLQLAEKINHRHEALVGITRRLVSDAVEIGGLFSQARKECEHGEFEKWLEQNIEFSRRNAFRYLSLFDYQAQVAGARKDKNY